MRHDGTGERSTTSRSSTAISASNLADAPTAPMPNTPRWRSQRPFSGAHATSNRCERLEAPTAVSEPAVRGQSLTPVRWGRRTRPRLPRPLLVCAKATGVRCGRSPKLNGELEALGPLIESGQLCRHAAREAAGGDAHDGLPQPRRAALYRSRIGTAG